MQRNPLHVKMFKLPSQIPKAGQCHYQDHLNKLISTVCINLSYETVLLLRNHISFAMIMTNGHTRPNPTSDFH